MKGAARGQIGEISEKHHLKIKRGTFSANRSSRFNQMPQKVQINTDVINVRSIFQSRL